MNQNSNSTKRANLAEVLVPEMDEESLSAPAPERPVQFPIISTSRILGLKLTITQKLLDLAEEDLRIPKVHDHDDSMPQATFDQQAKKQKACKACNFNARCIRIGNWEFTSRRDGDFITKIYFSKRKLVWEFLNGRLKQKMDISWSDITSIKADFGDQEDSLFIQLSKRPAFSKEVNPQPRKHTNWEPYEDFTDNQQASLHGIHHVLFPAGSLRDPYERLLQSDERLFILDKQPFQWNVSFDNTNCLAVQFGFNSPAGQVGSPAGQVGFNSPAGQVGSPAGQVGFNSPAGQVGSPAGQVGFNSPAECVTDFNVLPEDYQFRQQQGLSPEEIYYQESIPVSTGLSPEEIYYQKSVSTSLSPEERYYQEPQMQSSIWNERANLDTPGTTQNQPNVMIYNTNNLSHSNAQNLELQGYVHQGNNINTMETHDYQYQSQGQFNRNPSMSDPFEHHHARLLYSQVHDDPITNNNGMNNADMEYQMINMDYDPNVNTNGMNLAGMEYQMRNTDDDLNVHNNGMNPADLEYRMRYTDDDPIANNNGMIRANMEYRMRNTDLLTQQNVAPYIHLM